MDTNAGAPEVRNGARDRGKGSEKSDQMTDVSVNRPGFPGRFSSLCGLSDQDTDA